MEINETNVLDRVVGNTQSELILFFVLVVVALVVVLIPLYRMVSKDRKERRESESKRISAETEAANARQDKYIEREKQIIQVITANTEVMAGLKVTFTEVTTGLKSTLESSGAATNTSLMRIHERIDALNGKQVELSSAVARVESMLGHTISAQSAMIDSINKTLLTMDSTPTNSNFRAKEEI